MDSLLFLLWNYEFNTYMMETTMPGIDNTDLHAFKN